MGIELVKDAKSMAADGPAARYVAERMRDKGVLISTDGPHKNVLKIKPPLVFKAAEMERLISTLSAVLCESPLR